MSERKGFPVRLSKQDRQEIKRLLSGGLQPVRTVLRALALRQLADGQTIRKVAASVVEVGADVIGAKTFVGGPTLRVPHTKDVQERLRIAAHMLNTIKARYSEIEGVFKRMTTVQVNGDRLRQYMHQVFPDPRRRDDEARYERALAQAHTDRAGAESLYEMGRGNEKSGVAGTLWAAYNGAVEYIDFRKYARPPHSPVPVSTNAICWKLG